LVATSEIEVVECQAEEQAPDFDVWLVEIGWIDGDGRKDDLHGVVGLGKKV